MEKFFGRLCGLWTISSVKHRWVEDLYDDIFRFCVGLTNYHIKNHPLREVDRKLYMKVKNSVYDIGDISSKKRKETQEKYRAMRRKRDFIKFRAIQDTDDETKSFSH